MKKTILAALAATALTAAAGAASAGTFAVTLTGPASDGSFSGAFSDSGLPQGGFTDTFTFTVPAGVNGATITTTATSPTNNVDFSSVTLDGAPFTVGVSGVTEFQFFMPTFLPAGTHSIVVTGSVEAPPPGGDGVSVGAYSGTVAFTPGVPEPASWALMILGVGAVGASLRQRRRAVASFA